MTAVAWAKAVDRRLQFIVCPLLGLTNIHSVSKTQARLEGDLRERNKYGGIFTRQTKTQEIFAPPANRCSISLDQAQLR